MCEGKCKCGKKLLERDQYDLLIASYQLLRNIEIEVFAAEGHSEEILSGVGNVIAELEKLKDIDPHITYTRM